MPTHPALQSAIWSVPSGPWAVGVSGGADSVALLTLLKGRADLSLHVVHLNHETRGIESDGDESFVRELAEKLGLPVIAERLTSVNQRLKNVPTNRSAYFRAARFHLFAEVVSRHALKGVILAHHALDQAETVLSRLTRGASQGGLSGMATVSVVDGLEIVRPLLKVQKEALTGELIARDQRWREDASNQSLDYQRNRLRMAICHKPQLVDELCALADSCKFLNDWVKSTLPELPAPLPVDALDGLPPISREYSARLWLKRSGVSADDLSPAVVQKLVAMLDDASTAPRTDLPGQLRISRKKGVVIATKLTNR